MWVLNPLETKARLSNRMQTIPGMWWQNTNAGYIYIFTKQNGRAGIQGRTGPKRRIDELYSHLFICKRSKKNTK